jgi:hypothetical protein
LGEKISAKRNKGSRQEGKELFLRKCLREKKKALILHSRFRKKEGEGKRG